MLTQMMSVQPNIGHLEDTIKAYVLPLAVLRERHFPFIGERPPEIILFNIGIGIPSMRQNHGPPLEGPFVVDCSLSMSSLANSPKEHGHHFQFHHHLLGFSLQSYE